MDRPSTTQVDNSVIEERVMWSVFARTHLLTGSVSAISLLFSFFSLFVWRQGIHAIQFILFLVGISGMVYFFISLFTIVTYFRFDGERLTVRRFGRRQREITSRDLSSVRYDERGYVCSLWLKDGSTFQFCFRSLPKARNVVAILQQRVQSQNQLEGHINLLASAKVAAPYIIPSAVGVIVPTIFAVMGLFAPNQGKWMAKPLGWLLASLMFLPLALLCFAVYNRWGAAVAYFCWDGNTLRLRKLGRRRICEYSLSDIESITSSYQNAPNVESGIAYWITMKSKNRYKFFPAFMPNGQAMVEELTRQLNRVETAPVFGFRAVTIEQVEDLQRLKPLLLEGEEVLWLARPRAGAIRGKIMAEIIFGIIPLAMGSGLVAMCAPELMRGGGGGWMGGAVGCFFAAIGLYTWTAPWRYGRLLSKTLYAVTNRRALMLDGVVWDNRGFLQQSESPCEVVDRDALELFEILPRKLGISLVCFSTSSRKGIRWLHRGFYAPQNEAGGIQAIKWLIWQNEGKTTVPAFSKNYRV